MSLSTAITGKSVVLKEILYGEKMNRKLREMGLTPGVICSVVSRLSGGSMVIDVRGTRLALGMGLATSIVVEEV